MSRSDEDDREAVMAAETRTVAGGTRAPEPASLPTSIDRYQIVGRIGEGGMGVVYEATDPDLKRRVAVKVVRGRAGLVREAQAMAQLSHPSVVPVFDVGGLPDGDGVFIAMELVEGETLRDWLRAVRRPWKEVVVKLVAAGRGLAAAHAAGIVHRDFKPANVLVGMDGRVRVTDFGLARVDETIASDGVVVKRGETGVAGTPGYVAPEALDGVIDAKVDQFAFCVSFYEALYGERPFDAGSGSGRSPLIAMAEQVKRAGVKAAPRGRDVPGWLRAMVVRGLAADPAKRWPSVTALLDAVERVPRRNRRIVGAGLAATVAGGVVAGFVLLSRSPSAPALCRDSAQQLAGVWDADRRAALASGFVAADATHGAAQASLVAAALDRHASTWVDLHTASCRATHVDHTRSPEALDLRMQCLERRRAELGALVDVLTSEPNRNLVFRGVEIARGLPPLTACVDDQELATRTPLPDDPGRRALAIALYARLAQAYAETWRGGYEPMKAASAQLVAEARELDHPFHIGRALFLQANVTETLGDNDAAIELYRDAATNLARAGDDRMEAMSWLRLGNMLGMDDRMAQSGEVLAAAEAAVARAGDPVDLRVELLYNTASRHYDLNEFDRALAAITAARRLLEPEGRPEVDDYRHGSVLYFEAQIRYAMAEIGPVRALTEKAIEQWIGDYGPDHPEVAFGHVFLGTVLRYLGQLPDARRHHEQGLRIRRSVFRDNHPLVIESRSELAQTLIELGQSAEALPIAELALTGAREVFEPGANQIATAMLSYSDALDQLDRDDEALAMLGELIETQRALPQPEAQLVTGLNRRAAMHARAERHDDALRDYLDELAVREAMYGNDHREGLRPLVGAAQALLRLGRPAEALSYLERAEALTEGNPDPLMVERSRLYHGQALVESGRDRQRGLGVVAAARARMAELGSTADLEVIEAWSAKHGGL